MRLSYYLIILTMTKYSRPGDILVSKVVRGNKLLLVAFFIQIFPCRSSASAPGSPILSSAQKRAISGRCYLLEQNFDVLEKIFCLLSPRDLALFCLTSKTANKRVHEFIDHYSESFKLPGKFNSFYDKNAAVLLLNEEVSY